MATRPNVRAFLFCDAAVPDRATGKVTLVGVFDQIVAPAYPAKCGSFAVYFKLSDLNGSYEFEMVILAPDLTTIISRLAFPPRIVSTSPLVAIENTGAVPELLCPFPAATRSG